MEFQKKRLRVLCLPGFRTNKDILSFQLAMGLSRAIKNVVSIDAESIDLVCINPTHEATGPPDEMIEKFFPPDSNKYYEWHHMGEKVIDGKSRKVYSGIDESENDVFDFIRKSGRFDCLLGFSQGAQMAAYLSKRVEAHPELLASHLLWKCAIIISGFIPRDETIAAMYYKEKPLLRRIPSIHVIGDVDFLKERNEALYELCIGDDASDATLIRHSEEHKPPTWNPSQKQLCDIVRKFRKVCSREYFWAFDFDGVLCDSARELGLAGFKAGLELFPDIFGEYKVEMSHELIDMFVHIRPYLETGYEAIIFIYLLINEKRKNPEHSTAQVSNAVSNYLRSPGGLEKGLNNLLSMKELSKVDGIDLLKHTFTEVRERWIENDTEGWLESHAFFETAVRAVKELIEKGCSVYIITTKQKQFAIRLLFSAGLSVPDTRVFGLGSGPKHQVLDRISREQPGKQCFFLEDRVATLDKCSKASFRTDCTLGLALWGYNTQEQKECGRKSQYLTLTQEELLNYVRLNA